MRGEKELQRYLVDEIQEVVPPLERKKAATGLATLLDDLRPGAAATAPPPASKYSTFTTCEPA